MKVIPCLEHVVPSGCLCLIQDLILWAKNCGSLLCKVILTSRKNPVTFPVESVLGSFLPQFEGVPSGWCASLRCPHILVSECVCVGLEGWRERKRRNAREGWIDYRKMPNRLVLCPLPLVKLSIKTNDLLTVPFLPFLCWFSRLRKAGLIGGQLFYVRCTPSSYGSVQSGKWPVTLVTPSSKGGRGLPDSVFLWNDFFRSSSV